MDGEANLERIADASHLEPEAVLPERASAEAARGWLSIIAAPYIAVPLLLALAGLLFIVNLGGYPLYTKGEPREAVTVLNMVHGGGVILPMRAGVEIPSKPLLMHWVAALLSILFGRVDEWTVRLPSAIFGTLGVLVCYGYARRLFDSVTALFSALMLSTTLQYLQAATGSRVDMTLTFFVEVALFEFLLIAEGLTGRRMLFYLALAAATLTKGPVGFVLPMAAALIWMGLEGRLSLLGKLSLGRGLLVIAVMVGGWYLAATFEGGLGFIRKQILRENIFTFFYSAQLSGGHAHPFYYIELALIAGLFPWSILLPFWLAMGFRRTMRADPRIRYLLVSIAAVLVFYTLAHSKRGVYLLALYPALTSALGLFVTDSARASDEPRWSAVLCKVAGTVFLFSGAIALLASALLETWPNPLRRLLELAGITAAGFLPALRNALEARFLAAVLIGGATAALGSYLLRSRSSVLKMVLGVTAGMTLLTLAANLFVIPAMAATLSLRQFTAEAMKIVGGQSVGYAGALNYDIAFYSGRTIPIVSLYDPHGPAYLLIWTEVYKRLPEQERQRFAVVLQSGPTELDGSGGMTLLKPLGTAGGVSL